MNTYLMISLIFAITAGASYINYRFFRLPSSIGLTIIILFLSTIYFLFDYYGPGHLPYAESYLEAINFNDTFLNGMLSFLLFAGALQINALELAKHKWVISILATLGVIISTLIVGFTLWWFSGLIGFQVPLIYSLLFGALIAPTDPIAVLSTLKTVAAPRSLELKIAGESLFNDGIGIAMFLILLSFASGQTSQEPPEIILLFMRQLFGGIAVGVTIGYFVSWLLMKVDDLEVSILITLALTTGGYYIANTMLFVSGPIAIVVAGLIVGFRLKSGVMSDKTIDDLGGFWRMIDEVLNAILFVLIGLEVLRLTFTLEGILVALSAIPIVLIARFISVAGPVIMLQRFKRFNMQVIKIMTWGGLRGGISIALALTIPDGPYKDEIMLVTYAVVVFSLIVQGLTIGPMIKRSNNKDIELL